MRLTRLIFLLLILKIAVLVQTRASGSSYDNLIQSDHPVFYLPLDAAQGVRMEADRSGNNRNGTYFPSTNLPKKTRMRSGDVATVFDGFNQYLEIPSHPSMSIPQNGSMTLEVWIRPDVLEFPSDESDGYVHFLGKGEPGQHEYVLRMYSLTNSANRPNRISSYVFNLTGGLGSGSYFEDPVTVGRWIFVTMVVNNTAQNKTVSLYKNGVLRKTVALSQFDVTPRPGNAPLRIATRDMNSFFKGAMSKVAIYNYALSEARIHRHFMEIAKWR